MANRFAPAIWLIGVVLLMLPATAQQSLQRVAFQREGSPLLPSNIVVMLTDGDTLQEKSPPQDLITHKDVSSKRVTPALSPDGQVLAFAAQVGAHYQLFTWKLDDQNNAVGAPVRLTQDETADAKFPAWSPDGTRLAYLSTDEGGKTSLCVINRDGTGLKVLVDTGYNSSTPAWGHDGQTLLFIDKADGKLQLRQIPVLTGMVIDIRPKSFITAACFSPDGTKIAAVIRRDDGLSDLWVLTPPGINGSVLCSKIANCKSVAWPDAQTIVFNATKVGDKGGNAFWTVDPKAGAASLRSFTGYNDPKYVTFFSVQKVNPVNDVLTVANPEETIDGGVATPKERVPQGAVTIIRPFENTTVRGLVPIKVIAQKKVTSITVRIGDMFTYAATVTPNEDEVSRITFDWDTQQLLNIEPARGGIPARYARTLSYPDGQYTIIVQAMMRDNQGNDQLIGKDSIKITVQNSLPDNELPGNLVLRYQYREADMDEEYVINGEGQLFGSDLEPIADLNATFAGKIRRSLADIRQNGSYDLRTTLRVLGRSLSSYPLTFGLNAAEGLPEEDVSALYTLSPAGEYTVVTQMREKIYLPLAQVGPVFSGTTVQVGSQWTGQMWVVNDMLTRQAVQVRTSNVVDGVEWIGDRRTLRIRSDYRLDGQSYNLPLQPITSAPGLFSNTAVTTGMTLKTADAAGVQYTWFDYAQGQIVRVENLLLYTFPLANINELMPPAPITPPATVGPATGGGPATNTPPPADGPRHIVMPSGRIGLLVDTGGSEIVLPNGVKLRMLFEGEDGYIMPGPTFDYNRSMWMNYRADGTTGGGALGGGALGGNTGGTSTATPPKIKPRVGNGYYLIRWSYQQPVEERDEEEEE